jgi:D-alanyl-D-alanine carboxypeptidase
MILRKSYWWLICLVQWNAVSAVPSGYVVLDPLTHKVVEGINVNCAVFPASLAKLMTLYIVFDALKKKKFTLNTSCPVSKEASRCLPSKLWVKPGQTLSLQQCILAVAVSSCNDVATVIAERIGGNVPNFVKLMNIYAKKLGMHATVFKNPSGWHHAKQVSSPKDIALLMRAIWMRFSQYGHFLGVKQFSYRGRMYKNTNQLLGKVQGLRMGKTGYTSRAGYNLSTFTVRHHRPVIVVVTGASNKAARDQKVLALIERFYQKHGPKRLNPKWTKRNTPKRKIKA